ncbi:MAG: hypothetical protein ACE5JM_08415, partial [Armatimonadota bacterium]
GPGGYGATLWIDNRSMRVVGYEHWRLHGATREAIGPRARLAYDTPIRPELFIAKTPGGAVTVDLRTGGDS